MTSDETYARSFCKFFPSAISVPGTFHRRAARYMSSNCPRFCRQRISMHTRPAAIHVQELLKIPSSENCNVRSDTSMEKRLGLYLPYLPGIYNCGVIRIIARLAVGGVYSHALAQQTGQLDYRVETRSCSHPRAGDRRGK